ncbi:hypothetical protein KXW98_004469 [Aspergillus fumigatus]|nr:hypothetical protein KXX10_004909 [Aspergillus fumigatus]KAH2361706.1 hypothetical protein KXV41_005677 [Aspergillus fumigatus]KAH2397747.1 hypothetical protein KXW64_005463 [Aspergillus fumigatus]KAH3039183.1 hypothetical protein KXW83_000219 [Aspergillus fumigatus]KAH3485764.1 hypothetical protein KXW98_004469 [Aspergillus fumigatus]
MFTFAKKSLWQVPPTVEPPTPQQEPVDEERYPVALKIINSNSADDAQHEKEIESHIAHRNPGHRGRVVLRTCLDDVERRFVDRRIPLPIATAYIYFLLAGLDYLHSECQVVHSDPKLSNILISFENESILTNFIKQQQKIQYKIDGKGGRIIYRCHNDFGALDGRDIKNLIPKIADFGLATRLDKLDSQDGVVGKQLGIYPIQPDFYRAPEVILGCGWDFKADIWNLGVLLWNILGSQELFKQVYDADGQYEARSHLAEMIALLGPPPKELLARSKTMSDQNWPQPVLNDSGKLCNNAQEFFGGPFFDAEGEFRHNELIPSRSLENTTPLLEQEEQEAFLSFVRQMLTWLPEERKTARELMDHQFLKLGG